MGKYTAHFGYYSEDGGRFETQPLTVYGTDVFEARRQAWEDWERSGGAALASCVKLCGLTWDASPLNLSDYFNAQAAYYKCAIKELQHVELNNDAITGDESGRKRHRDDICGLYGGLNCVTDVARDLCRPHAMIPPNVREEIQYAMKFVGILDDRREHEKAQALFEIAENASKWDASAMVSLTLLFREGSMWLNGDAVDFHDQFQKNGAYPVNADNADWSHTYVLRHQNASKVGALSRLPAFDDRHIIAGSHALEYECRALVAKRERMKEEYRTPENLLWTPKGYDGQGEPPDPIGKDPDATFYAVNLITGEEDIWARADFHGVLRPEHSDNIDFDALRAEYAAAHADERDGDESGEWEE